MSTRTKGIIAGLIANATFGLSVVWTKQALITYGPITSSLGRVIVALIAMLIYGLSSRELQKIKKKDFWTFVLGGIFMPFLFYILIYEGIEFIDAILAGILFATLPLFSPLAGYIFFRERFKNLFFIGMIISFLGVVVSITSGKFHIVASPVGIVLMILGVISYVSYSVVIKRLSDNYTGTTVIFYTSLIGVILLLPVFYFVEFPKFIHIQPYLPSIMAIVYMGVLSSFAGFVLYAYSLKALGTAKGMMFFNLVPIFAAIGAVIILGDKFTTHKTIGLIMVVIGLYLTMIKIKKRKKTLHK